MICTFTHRFVNPLDLKPEDICIDDIAHALACINRFVGHCRFPLSVAQHSVFVSYLVPPAHALQGLLHDAAEAYLGDVSKWVKQTPAFAGYREAEDRLEKMILRHYGCEEELHETVEEADKFMVRFEAWETYGASMPLFQRADYPPISKADRQRMQRIPWTWGSTSWWEARDRFYRRFLELTT